MPSRLPPKTEDINPQDLPKVQSLPATASLKDIVSALKESGGVIIKDLYSDDTMAQLECEIRQIIDNDKPWDGDFFPKETRRVMGLVGKSKTAAECIMGDDIYWNLSRAFLEQVNWYWYGNQEKQYCRSLPHLNTSIAFSIGPGATDQPLHRDDHCHHNNMLEIDRYPEDLQLRETLLGFFFAIKKTTKLNGATRFIPGSHLWGKDREPSDHLSFYAELEPGDGFFMLGSCYHGGSANSTENEERLVVGTFTAKGFMAQEENQFMAIPKEVVKSWPRLHQERLGYRISQPWANWVELQDPVYQLLPELKISDGGKDLFESEEIQPFRV